MSLSTIERQVLNLFLGIAKSSTLVGAVAWCKGVGIVVVHFILWYRRIWRATIGSSFGVALFFQLAFGAIFARIVPPDAAPGGSYLQFLTPGLLIVVLTYTLMTDASYPVVAGFVWNRVYLNMHASPLTPAQIVAGQLCWLCLRMLLVGTSFIAIALVLGGATGPRIFLSLLLAVFIGLGFSSVVMAFSASLRRAEPGVPTLLRLVLVPGSLFAGTYYPISVLPAWLQVLSWSLPQWHATELARAAARGSLTAPELAGHLAYGTVLLAVGWWLSERLFTRRLTR